MSDIKLLDMGDDIEVKFETDDNTIWNPAKIIGFRENFIHIEHPDGRTEYLAKGLGLYRRPQ